MYMRNACLKALTLALAVIGWATSTNQAQAQLFTTLIDFNSTWKYDRSGNDLGTAWRTNTYNDTSWQSGPGLLGFEEGAAIPAYQATAPSGFGTTFPGPLSQVVTTYYFRATFNFSGSTNVPGFALYATNLVDDGCAIYLNGRLAGGVRMPATFNAATLFTGPAAEGQRDVVNLTNFLRNGQNTIAVEVHQSSATSSDVVLGMKLVAITPQALIITNQPQSQTVSAGDPVTFTVGVQGGPVIYRWQKDGANLNSTSNTLTIASAQLANAGNYRVIVSNTVNAVTSSVAVLTVSADTEGPKVARAVVDNGFGSNSVNVVFDEALNSTSARTIGNYRLVPVGNTNVSIQITNILYSTALGALLQVSNTDLNWNPRGSYFLVLNRIADSKGNNIAPFTRVPVSIQITTNLTQMSDTWNYYDFNFFDPNGINIYTNTVNPWYGTNYVIDVNWGTGQGIFYFDPNAQGLVCAGDTYARQISVQDEPTLFRRTFNMPAGFGTNGSFRLRYVVDDGMVVYLNGVEIHRYNMPAGPLTYLSKALTTFNPVTCVTNVTVPVSGLKTGTNVLAAAVYQAAASEFDTIFGLEMDGVFLSTPTMPILEPATNQLRLTYSYTRGTRNLVVSWPTNFNGYSLVAKSALGTDTQWIQVSDQSNPYTNSVPTNGFRFFNIKKL